MGFMGLIKEQRDTLINEVIPENVRLQLTRLLRHATIAKESSVRIVKQNHAVNIVRNVLGLPLYVLEAEDGEYYYPAEHGWHNSQIELAMQRPDTLELVEIIADLIQEGILDSYEVNKIIEQNNLSFRFNFHESFDEIDVSVEVLTLEELEELVGEDEHPNIRLLFKRMEDALSNNDNAGVLHASATIFETLAKDIVNIETIQNQTLASFFDRYRQDSTLPEEILDYILNIYRRRNTEPLAGHGSTKEPDITTEEAVVLAEMTRAFVRIERQLSAKSIKLEGQEENKE